MTNSQWHAIKMKMIIIMVTNLKRRLLQMHTIRHLAGNRDEIPSSECRLISRIIRNQIELTTY